MCTGIFEIMNVVSSKYYFSAVLFIVECSFVTRLVSSIYYACLLLLWLTVRLLFCWLLEGLGLS